WPKRADEIAGRGSLYWVIRGIVRVRQAITGFEEVRGEDGIRRCAILLDPTLRLTEPRPRAAFQGWRYLADADAPPDIGRAGAEAADLPADLLQELDALGVRSTRAA
ncbi:MAG TPA: DUF1489 family protein, partial [Paracoccaceae bacterium]|nr:DUF1489 family protein [Paracoccaceae bacterium]